MKQYKATLPDAAALVRLLAETFLQGTDTDASAAAEVPVELWNHALLDPLREFLGRPGKEFRARLLEIGFRLAGGRPGGLPHELPLLVEGLHAGSLIIDDIEDDSAFRRGATALHRRHGVPVAINAANWLYFWAQVLLARLRLPDASRLLAHERLAECLMRCHEGQALDLTVRVDDLRQAQVPAIVHAITRLKTGALLGLATSLGAIAAGAAGERLAAIASFGMTVGVGLQMLDDVSGVLSLERRHKAIEDLQQRRATWIWAWLATELAPDTYEQLRGDLCGVMANGTADSLVERIRFGLGGVGLPLALAQLDRAVDGLRGVIGDGGWCDDVRAEFAWLERQYVQR